MLAADMFRQEDDGVDADGCAEVSVRTATPRTGAPDLGSTRSAGDLRNWLRHWSRILGFYGARYVHLGHLPRSGRSAAERPSRWLSTTAREGRDGDGDSGWLVHDPLLAMVGGSFAPFTWSTGVAEGLTDEQRRWRNAERARGVGAGIALPVQDHAAGPAYVSLFGVDEAEARRLLDEGAPLLAFTAAQFHVVAKSLLPLADQGGGARDLTHRESECLRLAALGCTVPTTATVLGIKERTIEFHLCNAAMKLCAANKAHAVAIATSERLIRI